MCTPAICVNTAKVNHAILIDQIIERQAHITMADKYQQHFYWYGGHIREDFTARKIEG